MLGAHLCRTNKSLKIECLNVYASMKEIEVGCGGY